MAWLNVTDDLPIDVEVGNTLSFDFEGSPVVLKIMRKDKGKVWAKRLDPQLYLTPEQADEQIVITPKK